MGRARAKRQWIVVALLLGGAAVMVGTLLFPGWFGDGWFGDERSARRLELAGAPVDGPSRNETARDETAGPAGDPEAAAPRAPELPPYGDRGLAKPESIRGLVKDKDGRAVADAIVAAVYKETRTRPYEIVVASRVRSEPDGFFVLGPLERRAYVVLALHAESGVGYRVNLTPGAWVEIILAPAATIEGTVTARGTGEPVAGATVLVTDAYTQHETVTDAEGKYVLAPLPAANNLWIGQRVLAVSGRHQTAERNNLILRPGATERVDFALQAGGTLEGRVLDARTLQPVAGTIVGEGWEPYHRTVAAGEDGAYVLPHVDTSPNAVFTARAEGYQPQERQSDGTGAIEFRLDRSLVLEGTVKDPRDRPLKGARVYLHRIKHAPGFEPASTNRGRTFTTSGPEGRFRFDNVLPGQVALVAFSDSFAPGEKGPIELQPGGRSPDGLEVALRHGVTVEGEVRDHNDEPIPDIRVQLQRWWGERVQGYKYALGYVWSEQPSWFSDERGRFVLKGAIAGKLWLTAWDRSYGWASTRIEGAEGERITDIIVSFAGASISGVFVTATGEPVPGANVQARGPKNTPQRQWRWTQTDSLGRFKLGGLKDGAYDINGNSTFGNPKQLKDIQAGSTDVELKLEVNHVLTGTVTSVLSGRPLERFTLSIQPKRQPRPQGRRVVHAAPGARGTRWQGDLRTPDGRFERPVTPGTYTVTVKAPGHAPKVLHDVIVEEHVPPRAVFLALDGGGGVFGALVDAENKPLRASWVRARVYRAPGEPVDPSDYLLGGQDRTDSKGRYFIEGLAPGTYLVECRVGRQGTATAQATVTGRERVEANLRMLPTGTVTFKVVDEEGNPVPRVMFQLRDPGTNRYVGWAQYTNAQGVSTSRPVRMGRCSVTVIHRKRNEDKHQYVADPFDVTVPAAGNITVEVRVRKKAKD